jgi:Nucleotide modification associated domain 1
MTRKKVAVSSEHGDSPSPSGTECWEDAAKAALDSCPRSTGNDHAHLINIETWLGEARDFLAFDNTEQTINLFRSIVDDAISGYIRLTTSFLEDARDRAEAILLITIASKQHDYGHDNILWAGIDGVIVRMHDKIARIKNLQERGADATNESLYDSWLDIAGYGVIALMLLAGTFTLDLKADQSPFSAGNEILQEMTLPLEEFIPSDDSYRATFADGKYVDSGRDGFEDVAPPDDEPTWLCHIDESPNDFVDPSLWHYETEHQHVLVGIYDKGFGDGKPRAFIGVNSTAMPDIETRCCYFTYDELNDVLVYLVEVCDYLRHTQRARELEEGLVITNA